MQILNSFRREGEVTLTSIRLLAPHFTPDNHREVLARARHKSKRDVERIVDRYFGQAHAPLLRERPTMYGRDGSFLLLRDLVRFDLRLFVVKGSGNP